MMQSIPLNRLTRSDLNVRKTNPAEDVEGLADDIAARGLKQNLVAIATTDADQFEVVAGGRRFAALKLLVERGELPPEFEVPVLIEAQEQGVETSLAENIQKVAMNPADEFLAFSTIIDQTEGDDAARIAHCARRFGVTERHVRGRLRLANLDEAILGALREGVIGLGSAEAYASVDDADLQAKVFADQSKSNYKPHDPASIREALRNKTYSASDKRVRFVGLDDYLAAGGRTDIDLFSIDASERVVDTKLLDKLFKDKLDVELPKFAKKHKLESVTFVQTAYASLPAPEGWTTVYDHRGEIRAQRKADKLPTRAGVWLDEDLKLQIGSHLLVPADPVEEGEERRQLSEEERAALRAAGERERAIDLEAFRLAFPKCAGSPLENRVFMPALGRWARITEQDDDIFLEVSVRVSREEFEAQRDAATVVYDEALAEQERQRIAAAEEAERAREELIANPPAVVETNLLGGTIFYRWADGSYADAPEASDGGEEDEAEYSFEAIADLMNDVGILSHYPSIEAFREATAAAEAEGEDAS